MNGRPVPANDLFNARNQLSEAFFRRVALGYANVFPPTSRRVIEFGFLLQAFFVLCVFIYLHSLFVRSPITCLDKLRSQPLSETTPPTSDVQEQTKRRHYAPGDPLSPNEPWPRYGILRVEVIRSPNPNYDLDDSYAKEFLGTSFVHEDESDELPENEDLIWNDGLLSTPTTPGAALGSQTTPGSRHKSLFQDPKHIWSAIRSIPVYICRYFQESFDLILNLLPVQQGSANSPLGLSETATLLPRLYPWKYGLFLDFASYVGSLFSGITSTFIQFCRDVTTWMYNLHVAAHEDNYIVEYALEYGFLRLSPAMRKRLNITVKLVVLDPDVDACFGGSVSRFLMDEFLGYDDLLLGSIKHLAASESVKGHMANVVSGQHYRLVSAQMTRSSYLVATIVMLLFTFCVSTILRYSMHQLSLVIADILQLFETNVSIGIPATPFMTVILALVAIETIMSEFFGDSFTAFYVILIVSICDHYEAIFCRTDISRRYWPRFFYLYHFAFYAYHYRFNGQFSSIALWVSWLFILHSMIYFFHHYELPHLLSAWDLRDFLLQVDTNDPRLQTETQSQPWMDTLDQASVSFSEPTNRIVEPDRNSARSDSLENDDERATAQMNESEVALYPTANFFGDETVNEPCRSNSTLLADEEQPSALPLEAASSD